MKIQDRKGFTLVELMIVVGVISIIAAIAVPGLLRARMSGNEASAIGSMRAIVSGEAAYAASGGGYATTLAALGLAPAGGAPFVSPDLSVTEPAVKSGYMATVAAGTDAAVVLVAAATCNAAATPSAATYYAHAEPLAVGITGQRSFAVDQRSTIYQLTTGAVIPNTMAGAQALQ